MIIDGHVHIHPNANGFGDKYDATLENLIKNIKESAVEKAVLLPIHPKVSNKFIADACKKYPKCLVGFASVDPKDCLAEYFLSHDIKKYRLKGLKLHPRLQNFDLSLPLHDPIFNKCVELEIPVIIDAFPGVTPQGVSVPFQIGEIASAHPDLKIIIGHAGGYKVLDSLTVAKNNKNVYLDLSYSLTYFKSSSVEQDILFAIRKIGADRCIYGSDHPENELGITFNKTADYLIPYLSNNDMDFIFGETIRSLIGV